MICWRIHINSCDAIRLHLIFTKEDQKPHFSHFGSCFLELISFLSLYFLHVSIYNILIITLFLVFKTLAFLWTHITLMILSFLFFLLSWLKNPGYSRKIEEKKPLLLELVQNYNPSEICQDCEILKSKRSRHCDTCRKCIEVFDHHCPWINNCVGVRYFFIICFYSSF